MAMAAATPACVPLMLATRHDPATTMVAAAQRAGVPLDDPSILDEAIEQEVEDAVGREGTASARMDRLLRFLHDGPRGIRYEAGATLSANEAYRQRRGDCMAHATLLVALARHLGVDAYYVHGTAPPSYRPDGEAADRVEATTHVTVGFDEGGSPRRVDVWGTLGEERIAEYVPLDDGSALALYHSNRAVEALHQGRVVDAERTLRFLAFHAPMVEEVAGNLAAVLVQQKKYREALDFVVATLPRFPHAHALFTNGYVAAKALGEDAVATQLYTWLVRSRRSGASPHASG